MRKEVGQMTIWWWTCDSQEKNKSQNAGILNNSLKTEHLVERKYLFLVIMVIVYFDCHKAIIIFLSFKDALLSIPKIIEIGQRFHDEN